VLQLLAAAGIAQAQLRGLTFIAAPLLQAVDEPEKQQVLLAGLMVGGGGALCCISVSEGLC
jgi:hypothetical protein